AGSLLSAGYLCDEHLSNGGWNLSVGVEDHRVVCTALSAGTQVAYVAEHLRQWDLSLNQLGASAVFHGVDLATTGVDVTDNIAHEFLSGGDIYCHDRLQKDWLCLSNSFLNVLGTSNPESHFRLVNVVVSADFEGCLAVNQWEARLVAVLHCILGTSVDG